MPNYNLKQIGEAKAMNQGKLMIIQVTKPNHGKLNFANLSQVLQKLEAAAARKGKQTRVAMRALAIDQWKARG